MECQRLADKVLPFSAIWEAMVQAATWNASVSLARFYQPLAGLSASETLADLSGETPEFRALEFYCIIWVKPR